MLIESVANQMLISETLPEQILQGENEANNVNDNEQPENESADKTEILNQEQLISEANLKPTQQFLIQNEEIAATLVSTNVNQQVELETVGAEPISTETEEPVMFEIESTQGTLQDTTNQSPVINEEIEKEVTLTPSAVAHEYQHSSEEVIVKSEPGVTEMEQRELAQSIKNTSLNSGALGMLSAYDSADDSDEADDTKSVIEITSGYRSQVIEIDSDESSSSDEEECNLQKKRSELEKLIQVDESDEEDDMGNRRHPPKVHGELMLEDLPPIEDLHITVPEQECIELGTVNSVIDQLLLVKTLSGTPLLDIGTILFLEKGQKVLGEIFDVLGQVADPLYCVRFNNNKQIKEKQINIGDKVYCAPKTEHTQLIILSNLTRMKGSDASWENDVEPPSKYVEYSDDEEEQAARRTRRNKNRRGPDDVEVVDLTKKPRQVNTNQRQQAPQQYYQEMHQQQPFNYQSEGNTWHSNYQPQFVVNPYAIPGQFPQHQRDNFANNQGGYQNQMAYQQRAGYQNNQNTNPNFYQNNHNNFQHNRSPQPPGGSFPNYQGSFQQLQGSSQHFPCQNQFSQQGGGNMRY